MAAYGSESVLFLTSPHASENRGSPVDRRHEPVRADRHLPAFEKAGMAKGTWVAGGIFYSHGVEFPGRHPADQWHIVKLSQAGILGGPACVAIWSIPLFFCP